MGHPDHRDPRDDRLINRFDYDGDYGTVLNRFLMQAAIGYPLTVHGTGGQTRAFIHIQDTVKCIQLALENPPEHGDRVAIFNQMTETHRVRELAAMISDRTGVEVANLPNPRNEADENELHVANDRFLHLGPQPDHPERGADGGGHRDDAQVRRPVRPGEDPVRLGVEQRLGGGEVGGAREQPQRSGLMAKPPVNRAALQQHSPERNLSVAIRPLPEFDVVYVKNPKAACSTLLVWLDRIHTRDYEHQFTNVHMQHRLPVVREVGWRKVSRMLSGSAYRFSFVRHPVRRLESAYWDKVAPPGRWRNEIQAVLGLPSDNETPLTFEQFVDAVEQQDPVIEMNPHWRPQHLNLWHPMVTYDHIGRLESFDQDLARICEEANLPHVPLDRRNAGRDRPASVYEGRPDLRRRVEELFATDIELYGY